MVTPIRCAESYNYRDPPCPVVREEGTSFSPRLAVWRKPFKYAIKVLAFSAIWIVVGIICVLAGIALMPFASGAGSAALGVIFFVVGYVVIYLGVLAAMFRYLPEAVAEEVRKGTK